MKKKTTFIKMITLMAILCLAFAPASVQAATKAKWLNSKTQYRKTNGKLAKNEVVKIGNYYYLFDKNAKLVKGKWYELKNRLYCASSSGKLYANKNVKIKNYSGLSSKQKYFLSSLFKVTSKVHVDKYGRLVPVHKYGWDMGYEVTKQAVDYLSNGKTREGYYRIKPAKSGTKGYFQWIQRKGNKVTDYRPIVTVTKTIKEAFGRGDDSKPWYFYGKNVIIERRPQDNP